MLTLRPMAAALHRAPPACRVAGLLLVSVIVASLIVLCDSLFAESGNPATIPPRILISARNKDGSPAVLSASDLEVRIDGKPVAVQGVSPIRDAPLHYCLLIDSSGSQRPFVERQRDQAAAILSNIVQPGRDYGLFVNFNDEAYLDAEGSNPQKLVAALSKTTARGGTALYDAMVACSDALVKAAPGPGLRVMFIFSDGDDNSSHVNKDGTVSTLLKAGMRVYSIGHKDAVPSPTVTGNGGTVLRQFAEKTGGRTYSSDKEKDFDKILADISGELASLVAVTVASASPLPGDRFYKLEVKCSRKDVSLNAPRQYFAPPQ